MSRRGESIYKRKDGRWEARYIHHYENGKAKYRFLYASTYSEVKAKRQEELSLPENTRISTVKSVVVFHELSSLWLAEIKSTVKESTYTRYYRAVNIYLIPHIGDALLTKIDYQRAKQLSKSLLDTGGKGGTPLSSKTVTDILCVFKSILEFGRKNGYPCNDMKVLPNPQKSKKPSIILNTTDCTVIEKKLLSSVDRISLGILLSLYMGIRIGELCGLRSDDIDLCSRSVTIKRTVERISDLDPQTCNKTKVIVSEPKTENSVRVIPIPSFLVQYIERIHTDDGCYILTGTKHHTEPHQFYLRYKTFMKRIGLEKYTFHALRHTFATRCVENGFDAKSLSEILGHANVSTTLAVYVHPTLEQKRLQMERLSPFAQ